MPKAWSITAYTYEADHHCEACTLARFPQLREDPNAEAIDNEGNPVGVCFESDEHFLDVVCGDCGAVLVEVESED